MKSPKNDSRTSTVGGRGRRRWSLRPSLATALFLLVAVPAAADLVVTRTVSGDQFSGALRIGAEGCPGPLGPPVLGDEVRLSVAEGMARRDEPAFSVIVRLEDGEAFVVRHGDRTYSRLAHPPQTEQLASAYRKSLGAAAEEVFPFQPESEVRSRTETLAGREVTVREVAVTSPILGSAEVEVAFAPDPALGPAAIAAEALAQAIRNEGESWFPLLEPEGVPLRITVVERLPSAKVRKVEDPADVRETTLPPATFLPPEGYERVKHSTGCY